jgi:hypothetical protein
MRRGFSIFLILFFGLGPLSAIIEGSENASLPPCCRRNGAHDCAMKMRMAAMAHLPPDHRPAFNVPLTCPNFPGLSITILMPSHALTAAQASAHIAITRSIATVFAHNSVHEGTIRTYDGRGPPRRQLI